MGATSFRRQNASGPGPIGQCKILISRYRWRRLGVATERSGSPLLVRLQVGVDHRE